MQNHGIKQTSSTGFYHLGIAPALLEEIEKLGLTEPTPIQRQTIPIAIEGKDVMGIAQTGTGKTLAFGVPVIQRIASLKKQGIVIVPTRELAEQVNETFQSIGRRFKLRTSVLIGGSPFRPQIKSLARKPHVIIATPGRLIDHLEEQPGLLSDIGIVVLDEADRMLDMGFASQIQKVFNKIPKIRQTLLFPATMPGEIIKLAGHYLQIPVRIEVAPAGSVADLVTQELFIIEKQYKPGLLIDLLSQYHGPTLVFTRTKYGARNVADVLRRQGVSATEIHSNRSLVQRRSALEGFKSGRHRVLVATDIASRGIDVVGIELVINFDLPSTSNDYVHRIGRTARAGATGHAISFAQPGEEADIRAIELLTHKPLSVAKLPPGFSARTFSGQTHQLDKKRQPGGRARAGRGHFLVRRKNSRQPHRRSRYRS